MNMVVRDMTPADWPAVEAIYREGIATGNATFESEPPSWEEFDHAKAVQPRLVAVDDTTVVGWIAASRVSSRCVYEGVLEHSVYVRERSRGKGVGALLLHDFLALCEELGVWTVQSGVFPENEDSLALHHALGFRVVGTRERVGKMTYGPHAGLWRDVVLIEYRSSVAGT